MSSNHWVVPFKGRNPSLSTTLNFLWNSGNVYIMDNHRAAMWCWLQEVSSTEQVFLLHIDEHYDTLYSRFEESLQHLPELRDLSIDAYLSLPFPDGATTFPLIRWDNYLSLFLERYGKQLEHAVFVTHDVGDPPQFDRTRYIRPDALPGYLGLCTRSANRSIINIDLDFFFCSDNKGDRRLMFSDDYIAAVFQSIRSQMDSGRVACLTLCLTPDEDYTGGWAQAEALCARICSILGVQFELND